MEAIPMDTVLDNADKTGLLIRTIVSAIGPNSYVTVDPGILTPAF